MRDGMAWTPRYEMLTPMTRPTRKVTVAAAIPITTWRAP
jgi:hypothetical protein